jgi:type III secretory pathway component EscS
MLTFTRDYAAQARTASGINILLGIWLIASPWIFGYTGTPPVLIGGTPAVMNSVIVGAMIAILAASRLASLRDSAILSGVNLILALWTIASPWVYGYASNVGAVRDNVLLGVAIATLASWSGSATFFGPRRPPGAPAH